MKFGSNGSGDGQLNSPGDLTIDSSGNIYVVDTYNHRIQKFDRDGKFLMKFGSNGSGDGQFYLPSNIEIDEENVIYVADRVFPHRIQQFDTSGKFLSKFTETSDPFNIYNINHAIVLDKDGNIYDLKGSSVLSIVRKLKGFQKSSPTPSEASLPSASS
jgi:DNA-binding beta-propeller fold protein YncE